MNNVDFEGFGSIAFIVFLCLAVIYWFPTLAVLIFGAIVITLGLYYGVHWLTKRRWQKK